MTFQSSLNPVTTVRDSYMCGFTHVVLLKITCNFFSPLPLCHSLFLKAVLYNIAKITARKLQFNFHLKNNAANYTGSR